MNKINISDNEINYLLDKFPSFELSYDKILHRKVFINNLTVKISENNKNTDNKNNFESNILLTIIPKGKKYIIWFTTFKETNKCYLIDIDNNSIISIFELTYCYDNELCYNTILYGTLVNKINNNLNDNIKNNSKFFTCEDIFYYKNKNVQNYKFNKKLELLKSLFKNYIKNENIFNQNTINITFPIMRTYENYNINDIFLESSYLPYEVYGINIRDINTHKSYGIIKNELSIKNSIFKIKANIKQDIYNLYCNNDGNDYYYGVAYIPDYKTSVFMNNLFRNIKENKNLDLLEESDDDEEFENINENKFVDLDKSIFMMCTYIEKFRKWKPIKIINENELNADNNIITKNELHEMMKNLINETKDGINYTRQCNNYIQKNKQYHHKNYQSQNNKQYNKHQLPYQNHYQERNDNDIYKKTYDKQYIEFKHSYHNYHKNNSSNDTNNNNTNRNNMNRNNMRNNYNNYKRYNYENKNNK